MPRRNRTRADVVSLDRNAPSRGPRPCEPALGRLVGTGHEGEALVRIEGDAGSHPARSTVRLRPADVGREVTLLVERTDAGPSPIITGVVSSPEETGRAITGADADADTLHLDAERLLLTAEREITLRCGPSIITLTRDGKVLVKGANLLQTASGLNRIKGAAIQIN